MAERTFSPLSCSLSFLSGGDHSSLPSLFSFNESSRCRLSVRQTHSTTTRHSSSSSSLRSRALALVVGVKDLQRVRVLARKIEPGRDHLPRGPKPALGAARHGDGDRQPRLEEEAVIGVGDDAARRNLAEGRELVVDAAGEVEDQLARAGLDALGRGEEWG